MKNFKPQKIQLETSTACQLNCPLCPTADKSIHKHLGLGKLSFENFKNLINKNKFIKEIELSNYGEIFLNKDLEKMLEYAFTKKIILRADNGVNLNSVQDSTLEAIAKYKFRSITCSIDGAIQETYSQYRRNGNIETVFHNIESINKYKAKYHSKFPILTWQYVIFGINEKELPLAKQKAKELKMNFSPKLSWDENFSPIIDSDFVKKETGFRSTTRSDFKDTKKKDAMIEICHQLWESPQINWDGRVLGCCINSSFGDFGGNAFDDALENVLNSEKLNYAKEMLQGKVEKRKDIPCSKCDIYNTMIANQHFLKRSWKRNFTKILKSIYRKLHLTKIRNMLR